MQAYAHFVLRCLRHEVKPALQLIVSHTFEAFSPKCRLFLVLFRWDQSCRQVLHPSAQQQMLPWASQALPCRCCWSLEPTPHMHDGQRLVKSGAGSQTGPETFSARCGTRNADMQKDCKCKTSYSTCLMMSPLCLDLFYRICEPFLACKFCLQRV